MKSNGVKLHASFLLVTLIFIFLPCSSKAGPLDVWHLRNSLPQGINLNGITFGNEIFVVVGDAGTILTSPDGVNWTVITSTTTNGLRGIAFGNGVFVAVGVDGTILTSPDGVTWTTRNSGTAKMLEGVAFGNPPNPNFVVVGIDGTILTSPDGANWTAQFSGTTDWIFDVTYGKGIFAVVGFSGILTSSDGINWTHRAVGGLGGPVGIAFGNGTFIAVGGYGIRFTSYATINTSLDGAVWAQSVQFVNHPSLDGVTVGDGVFVVVGGHTVFTSSEGVNWTPRSSGTNSRLLAVAHANGTFVAVGQDSTILQSDPPYVFHDVPPTNDAFTQIEAIQAAGITGGCTASPPLFCPAESITRGQMAVFLVTSLGQSPVPCTGRFVDVPIGHPFCGFIEQMFSGGAGITAGCDFRGPTFCVDEPVTRAQMAVFIEAALGNPPNTCTATRFTDVTPVALGDTVCGFIERLADDGITGGCTPTTFCPFDLVTRAQMAVFLAEAPLPLAP